MVNHIKLYRLTGMFVVILGLFGIFGSAPSKQVCAADIGPLQCTSEGIFNSGTFANDLDASCRCKPNQCRLSIIDNPNLNARTNQSGSTTIQAGTYSCFDSDEVTDAKNYRLSGTDLQLPYKGNAQLSAVNKANSTERQVTLEGYYGRYITDEGDKNKNDTPCYMLNVPDDITQLIQKIFADLTLSDTPNTIALNGEYCGRQDQILAKFGEVGLTNVLYYTCKLIPNKNTKQYTHTVRCDVEDRPGNIINPQLNDKSPFYTKFYVDAFNKLPNNQNIPEGAVCHFVPSGGNNKYGGRAYWYYPNYFGTSNPNGNYSCTSPLLVSKDLFGKPIDGTSTVFGCLPNSFNGVIAFVVRLVVGLTGLVTFLVILINLLKIISNSTNADVIADSRKKISAALITFVVLIASLTILNILGLKILDLGSYGGGILRIFTGG